MSDLHGQLPEIPPCDILLIAGDICPDYMSGAQHCEGFESGKYRQAEWLRGTFDYWLSMAPAKRKVGIAGNHDFVFEHKQLLPDLPWVYLEDSEVEIFGLKIYGSPWVPNLPRWAFHADERKRAMAWDAIPIETDILMTHGPPFGYGDEVAFSREGENPHVGDYLLTQAIPRIGAKLHVFGHIHEGRGVNYRHGHVLANVAVVDEFYNPYDSEPLVFKLPRPDNE